VGGWETGIGSDKNVTFTTQREKPRTPKQRQNKGRNRKSGAFCLNVIFAQNIAFKPSQHARETPNRRESRAEKKAAKQIPKRGRTNASGRLRTLAFFPVRAIKPDAKDAAFGVEGSIPPRQRMIRKHYLHSIPSQRTVCPLDTAMMSFRVASMSLIWLCTPCSISPR